MAGHYIGRMTPRNERDTRGWNIGLIVLLVLALAIRVLYLFQYQESSLWESLTVDNWYHHNWANSLAEGNIFGDTTYFRAPLYIYCLGLLYAVLGTSLWVARLFGLAVGLASVALTYLLGRKLVDHRAGVVAGLLHAFYPIALYFEGELLLDSLFMLLVEAAVLLFLRWQESRQGSDLLWAGLACGLAAITRPTVLVMVPLILVWVLIASGVGSRARQVFLFLVGLALVVGPVFVRNLLVAGDPVLISSQGGVNLFIGNNDRADGFSAAMPEPMGHNWEIAQVTWQAEQELGKELKPGEVSDYWRDRALAWITSHPGRFIELYIKKLYFQIGDLEIANNRSLRTVFDEIPMLRLIPLRFGFVFALAVAGLIAVCGRSRGMPFVLLFMGLYIAVVSVFFYNSRFRLPLLPFYFVLAAAGLWLLVDQIRSRSTKVVISLVLIFASGVASFSTAWVLPYSLSPQSALSAGLVQYRRGDYQAAMRHFREAEAIDPGFPEVSLDIGACFIRQGEVDSALHYLRREQSLHPDRVRTYHNLASIELVNGNLSAARAWARTAVEIAPYDVTANILLVRSLGADSSVAENRLGEEIRAAAQRTGNDLYFLNEAAAVMSRRSDLNSAERLLKDALEAAPPPIETDPLAFRPDFRNARDPFRREKAKAWHLLGYLAAIQGRVEEAVSCSGQAVTGDPEFAEAYVNLINALRVSGRTAEADSVAAIVREKFPDQPFFR